MTGVNFKTLKSKAQLTQIATDIVAARLLEDMHISTRASLMVSGGTTPRDLYQNLSESILPWAKVKIGLVDERWVDEDDTGSNAALIRKTLLQNQAKDAQFFPMKTHHQQANDAQRGVEKIYQTIERPYSASILGMGTDGHTASWFPNARGLSKALTIDNPNLVQAIMAKPSKVTGAHLERMTLTRTALDQSKLVLLLITGDEKRRVFETVMQDAGSQFPIRAVIDALQNRLIVLWAP